MFNLFLQHSILFVKRQSLTFYDNHNKGQGIDLPLEAVIQQEVKDKAQLGKILTPFLENARKRWNLIIVLAEEVVFSKLITKEFGGEQSFWEEIPADSTKQGKKTILDDNGKLLLAFNKDLVSEIETLWKGKGGVVNFVVAASALPFKDQNNLTTEDLNWIKANKKKCQLLGFNDQMEIDMRTSHKGRSLSKGQIITIVAGLIIFLASMALILAPFLPLVFQVIVSK